MLGRRINNLFNQYMFSRLTKELNHFCPCIGIACREQNLGVAASWLVDLLDKVVAELSKRLVSRTTRCDTGQSRLAIGPLCTWSMKTVTLTVLHSS